MRLFLLVIQLQKLDYSEVPLLEKGFSAFYKKISFLPQSFSTKEFSAYEPDASGLLLIYQL